MKKLVITIALITLPSASIAQVNPNVTNTWTAYQRFCLTSAPTCPSPKVGVALNTIGKDPTGENDFLDAVGIAGTANAVMERYDFNGGVLSGVGANEIVGGFWGAARESTGSDPSDAGLLFYTTEAQTSGHDGMGLELDYTKNATTGLARGLSISPQGNGGVTIGGGFANNPYSYSGPSDLGAGTIHAASSIETDNHFMSNGAKGTVTACGTGAVIDRGGDNSGELVTGGSVTSCTYNFHIGYTFPPICLTQIPARPTPGAYINAATTTSITIAFTASYSGAVWFICSGITG